MDIWEFETILLNEFHADQGSLLCSYSYYLNTSIEFKLAKVIGKFGLHHPKCKIHQKKALVLFCC